MVRSGLFPVEAMIDDEIEMTDVIEKGFKPLLDPQAAMMKILIRVGNGSLSARSTGVQARQGSEFEAGRDAVLAEVSGAPNSAALHRSDLAESRRGAAMAGRGCGAVRTIRPLGVFVGLCFGEDVHVTEELASWCYAGHNRGCRFSPASAAGETVAVNFVSLTIPFYVFMRKEAEDEAAKLGVNLIIQDAEGSTPKQGSDLENALIRVWTASSWHRRT